jgi:hypothetical protein
MKTVNHYDIYDEKRAINGCVSVEFTALAANEERVKEMAEEMGIDLAGYTIDLTRTDCKDEMGRSFKERFTPEF